MEEKQSPSPQDPFSLLCRVLTWAGVEPGKAASAAGALLDHFRGLFAVFNAPLEEVRRVGRLEEMPAAYLLFFPRAASRYLHLSCPKSQPLTHRRTIHRLLWPYFCFQQDRERVYALCVNGEMESLACGLLGEGSRTQVELAGEKIIAMTLGKPVAGVFLAHNHPNAVQGFSESDFVTTARISHQLGLMGVVLLDHFLITEQALISMREALKDDYRLMWDVFATQPWPLPDTDLWQMPADQPDYF